MNSLTINPVGIVHSTYLDPAEIPKRGHLATIEVFPGYEAGLLRIEENSHLWILSWFHQARRNFLRTVPSRIDADAPEYGVFGLRSAGRPNPIALSLVWLVKVEGNILHVRGLDALDGSPVVDIKPYFENDIVFSPKAPYLRSKNPDMRYNTLYKQAYNHHQEECLDFLMALRMAMVAEELFGKLNYPELKLAVQGSPCLADTLQGLFRAKLAYPARFTYQESEETLVRWWDGKKELTVSLSGTPTREQLLDLAYDGFLEINVNSVNKPY